MRVVGVTIVLCAYAVLARAQTHPCDVVPPNNPNLTSPVKGGFCHNGLDAASNPTTVTAFRLYIDGQLVFSGPLTPVGAPTADGRFYFETPPVNVTKGSHAVTFTAVSADGESAPSPSYPFVLAGAPPAPPTNPRAKK
jgi:hypothetical protein